MSNTKTPRITSGNREIRTIPDGSLPPHMEHLRPRRRDKAPASELSAAARAALVEQARANARRNDTVALVRSLTTPARKRGGARYGPAPAEPPHPGMQAPEPMDKGRRLDIYTGRIHAGRPTRTLTRRQERQLRRKNPLRGLYVGKGRPTPKRKASR